MDPKVVEAAPDESRPRSSFVTKLRLFRRVVSEELGCAHEQLVFDEINDVYCKHCRKDFTG